MAPLYQMCCREVVIWHKCPSTECLWHRGAFWWEILCQFGRLLLSGSGVGIIWIEYERDWGGTWHNSTNPPLIIKSYVNSTNKCCLSAGVCHSDSEANPCMFLILLCWPALWWRTEFCPPSLRICIYAMVMTANECSSRVMNCSSLHMYTITNRGQLWNF